MFTNDFHDEGRWKGVIKIKPINDPIISISDVPGCRAYFIASLVKYQHAAYICREDVLG